jgi:hypothetical protein
MKWISSVDAGLYSLNRFSHHPGINIKQIKVKKPQEDKPDQTGKCE